MARVSSQGTRLWMQGTALPSGRAIASATKAAPCVVSLASPPPATFKAGAIVQIAGTGWHSLDGRAFRIDMIDGVLVMLGDSDTSHEPSTALPGTLTLVDLIEFCTASLDVAAPASDDLDTTTIYDEARTVRTGLPAINTWAADGFWDATDQAQQRAQQLYRSREMVVFTARFNDDSGLIFHANLNTLETRAGVDEAVTIATGGSISGASALLLVVPDFDWIIAGIPAAPSAPDWIIGGTPAAPSPNRIIGGQVGQIAA
jgi:hypothetical protein